MSIYNQGHNSAVLLRGQTTNNSRDNMQTQMKGDSSFRERESRKPFFGNLTLGQRGFEPQNKLNVEKEKMK